MALLRTVTLIVTAVLMMATPVLAADPQIPPTPYAPPAIGLTVTWEELGNAGTARRAVTVIERVGSYISWRRVKGSGKLFWEFPEK